MDSGHVLGAISPFASGQSRTSLDWIENDTDMGNAGTVLHFTCQRASATDRCGSRERDRQRLCILQYRAIISKSVAKP